jgi:drug/metabolite transporter (DMT)-like permease
MKALGGRSRQKASPKASTAGGIAPTPDALTLVLFVAIVFIAGGNPVAVRFSNAELSPFWGAGLRFAASALLLFAIVALQRLPLPRGRALAGIALYGFLGCFGFFALIYTALNHLRASVAAPLMASVPLITLFLALAHRLESFRWRALAGGAISVAGIAVLSGVGRAGSEAPIGYVLMVLAASFCAAEGTIVLKKLPRTHPIALNAIAMSITGVLLLGLSFATGEPHALPDRARTWTALAFLTIVGTTVMFVLYTIVVSRWQVTGVAYQFVLFPIVSVLLAAWLADEPITASLAYGGALVLIGVYIGALSGRRVPRPTEEPAAVPCVNC